MQNRLHNIYWFKNLSKYINWGLSQCENCAHLDNAIPKNYSAPLKPLPIAVQPFDCIHIDMAGPLPMTDWGNRYFIVATDGLTRYSELGAIPSKDCEVVAWWMLKNVICRWGYVWIKVTNNGGEIVNHLNTELMKLLDIKHRLITPYHPQSNGKAESVVKRTKKALKHSSR